MERQKPFVALRRRRSKMRNPRTQSNPAPPRGTEVRVHLLPEDVIADILSRLPGKSVLRFRAVCRAWRRITTDPHFLAVHAGRRPLEVMCTAVERRPRAGCPGRHNRDLLLDSIPVAAAGPADRRRLIRFPNYITETPARLTTHILRGNLPRASCAGALLFRKDLFKEHRRYFICNPVTRRWTELPRLPKEGSICEYGFYFHQSSGEYRFLCRLELHGAKDKYYIISTGAKEARHVSTGDVGEAADEVIRLIGRYNEFIMHVVVQDRLHWMSQSSTGDRKIVAFDTVSEMFQPLMPPPPPMSSKCVKLFDMNQMLAAANFGETHIDLWFLEDYDARKWVHRHQIVTPPLLMNLNDLKCDRVTDLWRITAASDDGEDVILGIADRLMLVYNAKTKTTRTNDFIQESKHNPSGPRHLFRESLLPHGRAGPSGGHPMVRFG